MRYYNSLITVGTNNRKRLAHLEEENLKLDNERLRLEINQLKHNKEIFNLQKEILVLKKQKLEFEIQASYLYFTEAMSSRSHFSLIKLMRERERVIHTWFYRSYIVTKA